MPFKNSISGQVVFVHVHPILKSTTYSVHPLLDCGWLSTELRNMFYSHTCTPTPTHPLPAFQENQLTHTRGQMLIICTFPWRIAFALVSTSHEERYLSKEKMSKKLLKRFRDFKKRKFSGRIYSFTTIRENVFANDKTM
jgi:hypothetical protein